MSSTTPPLQSRAKRLLFDGAELTEVPSPHRRTRRHKKRKDNDLQCAATSHVETLVGSTFRLVEPAMSTGWTSRRRSTRSRRRGGYLVAVAIGGGGALLAVWFATRSGEPARGVSSPALEAATVEDEAVPVPESEIATITFAAPRSPPSGGVPSGSGDSNEEGAS